MKFEKQWLQDLVWEEHEEAEIIKNEIVDTSRWSVHHTLIFMFEDKYYRTYYSVGATENQDESPFEYEPDMIECEEVVPVEKTVIVYESIK